MLQLFKHIRYKFPQKLKWAYHEKVIVLFNMTKAERLKEAILFVVDAWCYEFKGPWMRRNKKYIVEGFVLSVVFNL